MDFLLLSALYAELVDFRTQRTKRNDFFFVSRIEYLKIERKFTFMKIFYENRVRE